MPQPKKRAAKRKPEDQREDLEPDEDEQQQDDEPGEPEGESAPEPESDEDRGGGELKIVVRSDIIEIDLPRDGNEADTLERIAKLVDEL